MNPETLPLWMQGGLAVLLLKVTFDFGERLLKFSKNGKDPLPALSIKMDALLEDHKEVTQERRELTAMIRELVVVMRSNQERTELLYNPDDFKRMNQRVRDLHRTMVRGEDDTTV